MSFTISKALHFSASHALAGLPDSHPCGRLHGHNYLLRVELTGPVNATGFVVDYGDLGPFSSWVDAHLDHRHLNDVVDFNPTAELLSRHLTGVLAEVIPVPVGVSARVWVSETPRTWAVWSA